MAELWQKLDVDFDHDPTSEPSPMNELFFPFFRRVAEDNRLALVTVDWVGCPACGTGSPYIETLAGLPSRYENNGIDMAFGSLHWRSPELAKFNDPDLIDVVNQSYRLFHQMTGTQKQVFGGQRPVETFTTNPPHWRPKFPQLFFLDGRKFSVVDIDVLESLFDNGHLFHPFLKPPTAGGDPWVRSGDLNFTDEAVRNAVWSSLGPEAVLLQLTNYHLYRAAGDHDEDFMKDAMLETCDHVVSQFANEPAEPLLSFRYERDHERGQNKRSLSATGSADMPADVPVPIGGPAPDPASPVEPVPPPAPDSAPNRTPR